MVDPEEPPDPNIQETASSETITDESESSRSHEPTQSFTIKRSLIKAKCTKNECITDEDKWKLECKQCKRLVHFQCTRLPLYQIDYFMIKGNRKYVCETCTKIQPYLIEAYVKTEFESAEPQTSCETLNEQINTLEKANIVLKAENKNLHSKLADRTKELTKAELARKDLKDNVEALKKVNVEQILVEKIDKFEKKIDEVISDKLANACLSINEKMKETKETLTMMPEKMNESFNKVLIKNQIRQTPAPDFKEIISEERNKQLVQEHERKRRAVNIIIHGVPEENVENKDKDNSYVKDLMYNLGVTAKPESIVRLGRRDEANKSRPIKIRFKNEKEKSNVMTRLSNLKKAEEKFRRISITDDFTIEERQEIRRFVEEAKQKNAVEEGNFFWRVRGSPKTGLQLRRVLKKSEQ